MSDNIKVVVKVRPLISREIEEKLSYQWRVKNNTLYQLDHNGKDFGTAFTFDKVYDKETKTSDIYDDVAKPIVEAAIAGFNGTIFAYGQTSSGKTYTMTGTEDSPGIIPLAVYDLFRNIKNIPDRDFLVRVSYIEIYKENLQDLLNPENKNMKLQDNVVGNKVNCREEVTSSPTEVLKFLKEGEANRQMGATNMNEMSSRSHSIFQIIIESREHIEGEEEVGCVNVSQLNLVDLAGSERAGQTGATGQRFIEGININKSLSALALVIKQLSEDQNKSKYVSYRSSKLTRILQNSLGGNAKTSIICAITPAAVEETISTLQFANRAKAVKNKPEVNAVATDATMIQSLTKQLSILQSQLEGKKNLEVMLENKMNAEHTLQKRIARLQRLILNGFGSEPARPRAPAPRRATISTLHPAAEGPKPVSPALPKFHTPLLKYNPMTIPGSSDFVPIQNSRELCTLPEESEIRLKTPPLQDKKIALNDEIIDLDSDDDNTTLDPQACSPHHKCYGSSKTPPCVLRKNAKLAEKNFQEIIEFTKREKIYSPSVVELIEKLEQKAAEIDLLKDEVCALNNRSKEKDLEIDHLRLKITKSNEEVKSVNSAKVELEMLCKEYTRKLTDCEVSYDTLKSKTKRREDELLSLLDNQKKHKQVQETGKLLFKNLEKELNFMDMSKDISLVNSDNESSMTNISDDKTTAQVQDLVIDLQNQLTSKNESVIKLEADLLAQKQTILSLENSSQEMQRIIDDLKDKVNLLEDQKTLLQTTVETLNSTIKSQKCNLETANNDIESCNSVIQELQTKISNKENMYVNINENTLENMIANEEKFIATNENMKNIIHTFKIALESRNKEIDSLKSAEENNLLETDKNKLQKKLTLKESELSKMSEISKQLQDQINDHVSTIDKISQERNNLKEVEHQLTTQLAVITNQVTQLEKGSKEKDLDIHKLKESNETLKKTLFDKDNFEKELLMGHEEMIKNVNKLNVKILELQQEIKSKDNLITSLSAQDTQNTEYIFHANSIMDLLHSIISKFNGSSQDISHYANLNDVFTALKDDLNNLETTIIETITQKDSEIEKYLELKIALESSNQNLEMQVTDLQANVEEYRKTVQEHITLKEEIRGIICVHDDLRKELETKVNVINALEAKLNHIEEKCERFCTDNVSKQNEILSLKVKESDLYKEMVKMKQDKEQIINDLQHKITDMTNSFEIKEKELQETLHEKNTKVDYLENTVTQFKKHLQEKALELENFRQKANETIDHNSFMLDKILQQAYKMIESLDLEFETESNVSIYDNILNTIKHIATHVNATNTKETSDKELFIAQEKVKILDDKNLELSHSLTDLNKNNKALLSQMEEIRLENINLNKHLTEASEAINILRLELNEKVNEIDNMVKKTQELKEHFSGLDIVMKEQLRGLVTDNDKLLARCSELEINLNERNQIKIENENIDIQYENKVVRQTTVDPAKENNSPPSLLTICCNKIIETIQPNENSTSSSDSSSSIEYMNRETRSLRCECDILREHLKSAQNENLKLSKILEQVRTINQQLISDQEQVRQEVELILQPAYELQKKINSHKTNLSTLTATIYAENKLLRSQVKVLQHHHSRFHKVCQRDIPVVKKQLTELMTILKGENSSSHDVSFKRYSLPSVLLDNNNFTIKNLKNDSTLDGDLLMLDTNLTMTTSADNTLIGLDQTCLDMTQVYSNNDVGCQTLELTHNIEAFSDNVVIVKQYIDAQSSPLKMFDSAIESSVCKECEELKQKEVLLHEEIKLLSNKLNTIETQKEEIKKKYDNLSLEIPSTEALLKRINIFEKELHDKVQAVTKLTNLLSCKNEELKQLQEENDLLSTQVMENVSETDDLNKELDLMKDDYEKLKEKCSSLEKMLQEFTENDKGNLNCSQCQAKGEAITTLKNAEVRSKLNRSLSDSDTSTRFSKICTLQNELHAGREDCKELTEEVTVIKKHLERSNLSIGQNMDLDETMGEPNIFSYTKDFNNVGNKFSMPNSTQELDAYSLEKVDCINFFVEKTAADKESLDCNVKIIDVMKMFYTNCMMNHHNEVDNLVNKMKSFEQSRNELEIRVKELATEYANVTKKLEQKELDFRTVDTALSHIRQIIALISEEACQYVEDDKNTKFVAIFKENFLKVMDNEFGFTSVSLFENLIDGLVNKHDDNLHNIMSKYTKLQEDMNSVKTELVAVNNYLLQTRSKLTDKENEYNLLKAQKERIQEISNAVTLDIVKKEQELCQTVMSGCKKLVENNIICCTDIDMNLPLNSIDLIFDHLVKEIKIQNVNTEQEKEMLTLEIRKSKAELEENQKALKLLQLEIDQLKDTNRKVALDLADKDNKLQIQQSVHEDVITRYESVVKENKSYSALLEDKEKEITTLKEIVLEKETALKDIEHNKNLRALAEKESKLTELLNIVASYKEEIASLKNANEMVIMEKETAAAELDKSKELLRINTIELDKMTADILVLRESVKENMSVVETLKSEAKSLLHQNILMKEQYEEKCRDCSRLEMNIKTHEKTAEIQSKMIMRHQKQKEEDDKTIAEKNKRLEELTIQVTNLQKETEMLRSNITCTRQELDEIKRAKEALELRLSQTELELERYNKPRLSLDATSETTRQRRQSIHDSNRMFSDNHDLQDNNRVEAVFESRTKPVDLFMDVDEDHSNRSTPLRTSRGRDSLSRHDQSESPASRPSSVAETRRRRQSIHDLHRSGVQRHPETETDLHERLSGKVNELTNRRSSDTENNYIQSEVSQLRDRLAACQQELEDLKEQYRELDEECETCSQYLQERDEQYARLKKEKMALENVVSELKENLQSVNTTESQQENKPSCHVAVNTDEDWANLHSIVVDRMSYDAEVEKNKRLTKTIEELRFRKQDLKMTVEKMQKALRVDSKELEMTKLELKACKQELKELTVKYKELDEECETCSTYLQERDEQVRKLKEAKAALEAKLQEYEDRGSNITQSLRKKRQSMHDQRRDAPNDSNDAWTQVGDDFLSYQVERDGDFGKNNDEKSKELKRLKLSVEKLCRAKASLEAQLAAAHNPLCVATGSGIVQHQQLTDVMKENQKLKKVNAKLIDICKKRGKKSEVTNEDLSEQMQTY